MPSRTDAQDRTATATPAPHEGRHVIALWEGGHAGHPLPDGASVSLGRSPDADVPIAHTSVSRMHAVVRGGRPPSIEDLGSANGTRVNGARITPGQAVPLSAGSLIEIGSVVVLVQGGTGGAAQTAPELGSGPTGMAHVQQMLERVAASTVGVLLLGETGVGKGRVAEDIHERSPRSAAPFVPINCAALPESLLESELFGHERGAFTGAVSSKPGLFEAAEGGTILLDEVGELPLATQAKLLRLLESREVLRLGSRAPKIVDVRIIAATNRDLEALVREGAFRQDLYFRLAVVTITVPPLRDRVPEIAPLARTFLEEAAARLGQPPPALTERALAALSRYPWPGNVRELRNVMERAVVVAHGTAVDESHIELRSASLAPGPAGHPAQEADAPTSAPDLRGDLRDYERERITDALARAAGNQTRAAKLLGVSRRTLVRRLADYALPRPRKPDAGG